jgi:hypothetical protein
LLFIALLPILYVVSEHRQVMWQSVGAGVMARAKDVTQLSAIGKRAAEAETEDLFEMANLYPDTTGLPMTAWISPRDNARHDVRVNVNMTRGNQMSIANTAVVGVRPTPRVISGRLSPGDAQAVFRWIVLNTDALVAYWEGRIDTARLIQALKPLSSAPYEKRARQACATLPVRRLSTKARNTSLMSA